ncbi:MAG: hypothetical protein AB7V32_05460, partial [Candidatus Berkiella sp.]
MPTPTPEEYASFLHKRNKSDLVQMLRGLNYNPRISLEQINNISVSFDNANQKYVFNIQSAQGGQNIIPIPAHEIHNKYLNQPPVPPRRTPPPQVQVQPPPAPPPPRQVQPPAPMQSQHYQKLESRQNQQQEDHLQRIPPEIQAASQLQAQLKHDKKLLNKILKEHNKANKSNISMRQKGITVTMNDNGDYVIKSKSSIRGKPREITVSQQAVFNYLNLPRAQPQTQGYVSYSGITAQNANGRTYQDGNLDFDSPQVEHPSSHYKEMPPRVNQEQPQPAPPPATKELTPDHIALLLNMARDINEKGPNYFREEFKLDQNKSYSWPKENSLSEGVYAYYSRNSEGNIDKINFKLHVLDSENNPITKELSFKIPADDTFKKFLEKVKSPKVDLTAAPKPTVSSNLDPHPNYNNLKPGERLKLDAIDIEKELKSLQKDHIDRLEPAVLCMLLKSNNYVKEGFDQLEAKSATVQYDPQQNRIILTGNFKAYNESGFTRKSVEIEIDKYFK